MSNINYNLYKIFCAVAVSKTYAKAGKKLNLTASNICVQISNLENQLDTQLFIKKSTGVELTEEGQQLFEIINRSISSFDFAEKVIKEKNNLENGKIRIGCQSHISNYYLMDFIKKVKNDYPNLEIELTCEASPHNMLELLRNHNLDFIITDIIMTGENDLVIEELKEVNNVFVSKEPLKISKLKELEELKYILNFDYTNTTKQLLKVLNAHNINIKSKITCDNTELRVQYAKNGMGIAYVMREALKKELEDGELYEVQIPIQLPSLSINLVYIKDMLTPVDKKFIKQYLKK